MTTIRAALTYHDSLTRRRENWGHCHYLFLAASDEAVAVIRHRHDVDDKNPFGHTHAFGTGGPFFRSTDSFVPVLDLDGTP